jgi:Bacterial Ig domain
VAMELPSAAPRPPVNTPVVNQIFQHAPPVVVLSSPADGSRTAAGLVEVRGVASSTRGISRIDILVNGQPVPSGQSGPRPLRTAGRDENREFVQEVPLVDGPNRIMVTAVDGRHRATRHTRTVYRTMP